MAHCQHALAGCWLGSFYTFLFHMRQDDPINENFVMRRAVLRSAEMLLVERDEMLRAIAEARKLREEMQQLRATLSSITRAATEISTFTHVETNP